MPGSHIFYRLLLAGFILSLFSCGRYTQNIMFKTEQEEYIDSAFVLSDTARESYIIQPNDYIKMKVNSNKGELMIDPNFSLRQEYNMRGNQQGQREEPVYQIKTDGNAVLPMVGEVKLSGYTLREADSVLAIKYSEYYEEPYVLTQQANRRVVVLGPLGGQVVPLENENMNLIEVLALYGGIDDNSKAHNIRLIRGDLDNPQVQMVDLSTIKGMQKASLTVQPNDIVYIEPFRRPLTESVREISPLIGVASSLLTLIVLLSNLNR